MQGFLVAKRSAAGRIAAKRITGACVPGGAAIKRAAAAFATAAALLLSGSLQAAAQITLVAFGDSLTAGYNLPQGDGFAPQLETWLREQGVAEVTVVNAGVSGDTTTGGLARLEWTLPPETDAVILELGGNDLLRGIPPELTRQNLDEMMRILGEKEIPVLLAGIRAFGNYGDDYRQAFNATYPMLARKHDALLYPSFLEALGSDPDLFLPNDFHPNAKGVRVLVEDIGPMVLDLIETARPEG